MTSIRLDHLTKTFSGATTPAVDDVSLDIADGEFVILVGPSGCGKSTILRMIVGLEDVTAGDVYIGDTQVNDKAPRDRNLAMVFQNYALYPHLNVYENIAFPLRLHHAPDDDVRTRVQRAADLLELDELLDRKPAQLSGGQRQRVAMGRAIVRDAEAFLFDEPLSNLDAKLRGQMRTEISRLQNQLGITTVYVTHDQIEAMTLGDRVAVLRKGGVLQQVDVPRVLRAAGQPVRRRFHRLATHELPARNRRSVQAQPAHRRHRARTRPGNHHRRPRRSHRRCPPRALRRCRRARRGTQQHGLLFHAQVDVIEWLGSEQYAYVPFEAPPQVRRALSELATELDMEQVCTQLVIILDADTRIAEGSDAELWLDPTHMHLFDPESGENLTHGRVDARSSPA